VTTIVIKYPVLVRIITISVHTGALWTICLFGVLVRSLLKVRQHNTQLC